MKGLAADHYQDLWDFHRWVTSEQRDLLSIKKTDHNPSFLGFCFNVITLILAIQIHHKVSFGILAVIHSPAV